MAQAHVAGSLLGTAVGDALGLPYEGLSRARAERLFGPPDRHRLILGRGMVSDDTEHTWLVAQALVSSGGEVEGFRRSLAWGLRWWLLGLPAGVGWATLRATVRLWLGVSPTRSGVRSAGNGPAMRAAILGSAIDDLAHLWALIHASSAITHRDVRAAHGALLIALAARAARSSCAVEPSSLVSDLRHFLSARLLAARLPTISHGSQLPIGRQRLEVKEPNRTGSGRTAKTLEGLVRSSKRGPEPCPIS